MLAKFCVNCGKFKNLSKFERREDRQGYYAFDKLCMVKQCRVPDKYNWPRFENRGGGSLELEPRD